MPYEVMNRSAVVRSNVKDFTQTKIIPLKSKVDGKDVDEVLTTKDRFYFN